REGVVVHDVGQAGFEEQAEEGAGEQQDDERVKRDLTQQERPMVREDRPQPRPGYLGSPEPVVEPSAGAVEELLSSGHPSSQKAGPIGSWKSLVAIRKPSASVPIGSCGNGPGAGPKRICAPLVPPNGDSC